MLADIFDGQDPVVIATFSSGLVSASAMAAIAGWRSRRAVARVEQTRQADVAAYIDGVPAVPGVTDGVPAAALRTQLLERTMAGVVQGQALLEKRMDEANGTGRRTEQMVREIRQHLGMVTQ